ncbi:TetR family transcriptional regulator C-terminal domain-containing protein [Staphylococcus delphini]|uniref:TetR family transcriptional regulator C-terminal domain-containing protein n=1 Tax=Staphylococcus delphini TaxID=53344 RepID=UPI0021D00AE5|nr:TetR family transcriptional regulator C-terminal domain-containing protein [Staphylococcus delphini]UXS28352.1 TetR family transcriptional regulator C-terminal domain-containing protein [Staphylococcus delphini]UXS35950.1 TetR family transcriptional regulator C-terminal domain-containing protein [Staphylococcus delphini]UXS43301.1 TetR family transcriptional regulator C-terminal domain-containing protein [Staphylococcus delphini]UXV43995.1 TetR family transcriptional regulator C-terminal dom
MDKRIRKTQKALKQTILNLLQEKQIEEITVTDICESSEIVRRTFYAHYTDKYDLIERIMDDYISDFIEICHFKENVDFTLGNIKWFQYLYENREVFNTLFRSSISSLFNRKIENIVNEQIEIKLREDLMNNNLRKETLLKFLTSAVLGVMIDFTVNKDDDYETKANEVLFLLMPYFK